jgi:hypothetical protein
MAQEYGGESAHFNGWKQRELTFISKLLSPNPLIYD